MSEEQREMSRPGRTRRRRIRRVALIAVVVIFCLLLAAVLLGPAIAGSLAPGIISDAAKGSIAGKVTVGRASLSWLGKQTIAPVTVQDSQGREVAKLSIEVSSGLLALARGGIGLGPMDLGKVTVSGDATLIREADGTTSIDRLLKPSAPATPTQGSKNSAPAHLPAGLKGELDIASLNIRFKDEAAQRDFEVKGMSANASLGEGKLSLSLKAAATALEAGIARPAGSIDVSAQVTNFTDASGKLTPDAAQADVSVTASDLSTEIAGVLSGLGKRLVDGVGPTIKVSITAKGGLSGGSGSVDVTSTGIHSSLKLASDNNIIRLTAPGTVQLAGAAAAAFVPADLLADSGLAIDTYPDADVTIESLSFPIPAGGKPIDARSAAGTITVRTTPVRATYAALQGPPRRIGIGALDATITSTGLASGVVFKAGAGLTVDDAPAGAFAVDLTATGIVDGAGALTTSIPALSGKAALLDVSTTVAQSFIDRLGLDLGAGIGPKVDVIATASSAGKSGQTDVAVQIKSEGLNSALSSVISGTTIATRGEVSLKSPRTLAGKSLDPSGLDVSRGGFAKLVVRESVVDVSKSLDAARLDADASFGGFTVLPAGHKAAPIELNQVILTTVLSPGRPATVRLKASGRHESKDWFAQGDLAAELPRQGQPLHAVRPTGSVRFADLPTTLASLFLDESKGLDRLIADAAGPVISLTLSAAPTQGLNRAVTVEARAAHLSASLAAEWETEQIKLQTFKANSTLSPELAARIIDRLAPGTTSVPQLGGPATIAIEATAAPIPLKGFVPDLARAGDVVATVELQGAIKPPRSSAESKPIFADLRDLKIVSTVPISALVRGAPARPARVVVSGGLYGETNTRIADFDADAGARLADASLAGDVTTVLKARVQDARQLDSLLGKPGIISGAVGDSAQIAAHADLDFESSPAGPSGPGPVFKGVRAELSIASPRIKQTKPLTLVSSGDRIGIDSPTHLTWTPDAEWINAQALAPQRGGGPQTPQTLRIGGEPELSVRLSKFTVPMDAQGLFKPGVFEADVEFSSPAMTILSGKVETKVKAIAIRSIGGKEPGVIGFSIRAEDLGAGGGPGGAPALVFQGGVYNVADAAGKPTPDKALVTMTGDAFNAPSALLDSLANQGGMLAEVLGPVVAVNMRAEGASEKSGQLVVTATSPRAELELKGSFTGGRFISEGEPRIVLHSLTPELGKMLLDGMPLIGTLEKKPEDGPATVKVQGLVVPLDGKIEKLNGEFTIDLGTARFDSSGVFGAILRFARQRESGLVGRRLQPLSLSIKDGVLTYTRWKVPLGDFNFDTRGTVDLVNHKLDVITYIPFGALSDEAAGKLNTGLGRIIGGAIPLIEQATMVPFRTSGTFAASKTEADVELFFSEAGKTLLRPDRLIREGLEKLIKPDEKKQPEGPAKK